MTPPHSLDKGDLSIIKQQLEQYEVLRDAIVTQGRSLIKQSKRVIYAVHRDDSEEAKKAAQLLHKQKKELDEVSTKQQGLVNEGSYRVAIQEYVEAMAYLHYVQDQKIPTHVELGVSGNFYILGLCDLTGELVRRAVRAATKENFDECVMIKEAVEEIFGELLNFDFRDNETRRKFDSIKYDLKKLEELVLELKLKGLI